VIIQTFKPESYRDCKIYYRNFGTEWEYLVIINNELYTAKIQVLPTFLNRLLYFFGLERSRFSFQQTGRILRYLRKFAETTVDTVIKQDLPK
jgi:hypothetical protein